jgi:hypothetical protein
MVDQLTLQTLSIVMTGLTLSIAAIYYMLTLRYTRMNMKNTLETRKADILQRHAQINATQDFMDAWHDLYYNQNFLTYQEWRQDYGVTSPDNYTSLTAMIQYYEILGVLLRQGLVDMELVEQLWQPLHIIIIWEKVEPVVKGWRETFGDDSIYSNIEYLFNRYMERHPEANKTRSVVKRQYAQRNKRKTSHSNPK